MKRSNIMDNVNQSFVLIVDDNPTNLELLERMLSKIGGKLVTINNGLEALEFAKKNNPNLILLDVIMPEMDGYEVCERLKKNPDTKNIPVIFLTGKAGSEDIVRGFEVGGVDYVTKPFISVELFARVKTQIRLKQAFDEIKTLKGFIPICAKCKKIRDDNGFWKRVEKYIEDHSEAKFTHGICPDCLKDVYSKYGEMAPKTK